MPGRRALMTTPSGRSRIRSTAALLALGALLAVPGAVTAVATGPGADTATITGAGIATINYDPLAVGQEGTARTNKQGAFYSLYGSTSSTGLLMAWAWGVSRVIDVIAQSDGSILKADALGVTGC